MWIVGGDVNQGHYHDDVWNSADGKTWTLVNEGKPVPWGPRALHYTVVFRDKIWVMGGQTDAAASRRRRRPSTATSGTRPTASHWTRVEAGGAVLAAARHDRRQRRVQGPDLDPRRRHLRHAARPPTRKFYNDVWSSADGVRWTRHVDAAPWAAAAVSRRRRLRRPPVGPGGLFRARTATTSGTRPTASLARGPRHALGSAPRRQRLRPRRRPVDGRGQQHGAGRVEAGAER